MAHAGPSFSYSVMQTMSPKGRKHQLLIAVGAHPGPPPSLPLAVSPAKTVQAAPLCTLHSWALLCDPNSTPASPLPEAGPRGRQAGPSRRGPGTTEQARCSQGDGTPSAGWAQSGSGSLTPHRGGEAPSEMWTRPQDGSIPSRETSREQVKGSTLSWSQDSPVGLIFYTRCLPHASCKTRTSTCCGINREPESSCPGLPEAMRSMSPRLG